MERMFRGQMAFEKIYPKAGSISALVLKKLSSGYFPFFTYPPSPPPPPVEAHRGPE